VDHSWTLLTNSGTLSSRSGPTTIILGPKRTDRRGAIRGSAELPSHTSHTSYASHTRSDDCHEKICPRDNHGPLPRSRSRIQKGIFGCVDRQDFVRLNNGLPVTCNTTSLIDRTIKSHWIDTPHLYLGFYYHSCCIRSTASEQSFCHAFQRQKVAVICNIRAFYYNDLGYNLNALALVCITACKEKTSRSKGSVWIGR